MNTQGNPTIQPGDMATLVPIPLHFRGVYKGRGREAARDLAEEDEGNKNGQKKDLLFY